MCETVFGQFYIGMSVLSAKRGCDSANIVFLGVGIYWDFLCQNLLYGLY